MVERRFVVVRGRHRLHFKLNGFESGYPESLVEPGLREIVAVRVFNADEMNRPAPPQRNESPFRTDARPSHADP